MWGCVYSQAAPTHKQWCRLRHSATADWRVQRPRRWASGRALAGPRPRPGSRGATTSTRHGSSRWPPAGRRPTPPRSKGPARMTAHGKPAPQSRSLAASPIRHPSDGSWSSNPRCGRSRWSHDFHLRNFSYKENEKSFSIFIYPYNLVLYDNFLYIIILLTQGFRETRKHVFRIFGNTVKCIDLIRGI